jgi:hypothetical protein
MEYQLSSIARPCSELVPISGTSSADDEAHRAVTG